MRRQPAQSDGPDSDDDDNNSPAAAFFSREYLAERGRAASSAIKTRGHGLAKWLDSPKGRGILKCTLAYTIASLATFLSPISDFLGKPDGKHVVATITVYFHPARTSGSMIEAVLIATVAVFYAELVSILSMCVSVLVGGTWGMVSLAHALVLIVFIGGGFGFMGWVKQRMNNPLVNVGSTLASLAIIGVVTKETAVLTNVFSNQKIVQIFKMLIMGVVTTTAVNLLVWRVSAIALLRESMKGASISLGDMLVMVTSGFLSGSEDVVSPQFTAASSAYHSVYPQMTKNLREAKFERYFLGQERIYFLERAVVKSMETLAQSIGGLRSAANTQFSLLKESGGELISGMASPRPPPHSLNVPGSSTVKGGKDVFSILSAIDEASEESTGEDERDRLKNGSLRSGHPTGFSTLQTPSDIFDLFIALLGPSMKSLAYTLSEVLRDPPFGSAPDYEITINDHFRESLTDALGLFNAARKDALQELYRTIELDRSRSEEIQADFEEVAAACGHFSFSLQAFAEEMQKYLDVLDDLKHANEETKRSWQWLKWWRKKNEHNQGISALPYHDAEERETLIKPIKKTAMPRGVPDSMIQRQDTYSWQAAPESSRVVATFSQRLLRMLRGLARDDSKSISFPHATTSLFLTLVSPFWLKSRYRSHPMGYARVPARDQGRLPTLERGMGPPFIHDRLFYDCWGIEYHRLVSFPRDPDWRHSLGGELEHQSRQRSGTHRPRIHRRFLELLDDCRTWQGTARSHGHTCL